jgi:hypothetical protein
MDEDVAVWRVSETGRARIVCIFCSDGRKLEMDGYALTWTFPPQLDAIAGRIPDRGPKPA